MTRFGVLALAAVAGIAGVASAQYRRGPAKVVDNVDNITPRNAQYRQGPVKKVFDDAGIIDTLDAQYRQGPTKKFTDDADLIEARDPQYRQKEVTTVVEDSDITKPVAISPDRIIPIGARDTSGDSQVDSGKLADDKGPGMCNPALCMEMAVARSDCPVDVATLRGHRGVLQNSTTTECVCSHAKFRAIYIECSGFCTLNHETDNYCCDIEVTRGPVEKRQHSDGHPGGSTIEKRQHSDGHPGGSVVESHVDKRQQPRDPPQKDTVDEHVEKRQQPRDPPQKDIFHPHPTATPSGGWLGFCGVPGQACGKVIATTFATETKVEAPCPTDVPSRGCGGFVGL